MSIGRIISTGNGMVLLNKKNSYLKPAISHPVHTWTADKYIHTIQSQPIIFLITNT